MTKLQFTSRRSKGGHVVVVALSAYHYLFSTHETSSSSKGHQFGAGIEGIIYVGTHQLQTQTTIVDYAETVDRAACKIGLKEIRSHIDLEASVHGQCIYLFALDHYCVIACWGHHKSQRIKS